MSSIRLARLAAALAAVLALAGPAAAQDVVVSGSPRPEIRALVDAFVAAFNGTAADWEAMARAHFTPELLAKRTAGERAAMHRQLRGEFGTIDPGEIRRRGADAPLELMIEGSTGAKGSIALHLSGFRIAAIAVEAGGGDESGLPPPPVNGGMDAAALTAALDAYLATLAADDVLSGVVLVAKDGKPIFERAYGLADRGNRVPNTTATRFNLGSINKTFTQAAIAQLAAAEKISYATPLGVVIPGYPQEVTRTATIDQLLTHTAGIADFFGPAFDRASKDGFGANADYFRHVSSQPALFAPGERSRYCNGCYITLGEIIERVSGLPYEQYVAEHVFKPAGMTQTGYPRADAVEANIAEGYTRRAGGSGLRRNLYTRGAAGSAAGGGYATAADLLAYDNALREGRILDAAGVARLLRGARLEPGRRAMGDFGIAGGAPGINAVLESDGVWTVVVLTNLDPPTGEQLGTAIMRALARR